MLKNREYYGFEGWDGPKEKWNTVAKEFSTMLGPEPEYVYAVYSTPAYEGSADVIFYQSGQWFHASGGHCSCYGLEEQWKPEPIDPAVHLLAIEQGRRELLVSDSEGDYPEATQEHFNDWLKWAVAQTSVQH